MEEAKPIEAPITLYQTPELTLRQKLQLIQGKLHRFYVGHFQRTYVARSLARRQGECKRCGACCQLLFRCAFAAECQDGAGCRIYTKRPVNCRVFPLNKRDLADRDIMMPQRSCGYYSEDVSRHNGKRNGSGK